MVNCLRLTGSDREVTFLARSCRRIKVSLSRIACVFSFDGPEIVDARAAVETLLCDCANVFRDYRKAEDAGSSQVAGNIEKDLVG
jgi:hypothetical protein